MGHNYKIDEMTNVLSWSMVVALDLNYLRCWYGKSFLVDEEKKVLVCCDKYSRYDGTNFKNVLYIVGEDNQVRKVDLGFFSNWPFLFNYVPSLTQFQQEEEAS
ncbi:unnamed protein product [Arabidopsis thaliana]|uniref:F-box associated beta-propeller type 1 domain-containing protein n=1 Tax=Arabidopsis thaliana TaxID=3702 RepID=Q9LT73_ARATH|nr:unnamed protein product [Arabidopsis thaliana]